MRWMLVVLLSCGCACPSARAPAFPAEAHLTVRRSTGPDVVPFGMCSTFESSLGGDFCSNPWFGFPSGDGGEARLNYLPSLATYGYLLVFDAERAQLCREFGDEFGDSRGCARRDVRCASSGEVVITDGGGSVVADFPGGEHIEAAWRFVNLEDAGVPTD